MLIKEILMLTSSILILFLLFGLIVLSYFHIPVAFLKISILGVKNILDLLQLTETVRVCERERVRETREGWGGD